MSAIDILSRLVCARCGEMLDEADTLTDGSRVCLSCRCDGCTDRPYRFIDVNENDDQLCEVCVIERAGSRQADEDDAS